jgi:hypothetical protein
MGQITYCKYCGCDAEDHPVTSIPLGSFSCSGCGECPLIKSHVEELSKVK